ARPRHVRSRPDLPVQTPLRRLPAHGRSVGQRRIADTLHLRRRLQHRTPRRERGECAGGVCGEENMTLNATEKTAIGLIVANGLVWGAPIIFYATHSSLPGASENMQLYG